MSYPLKGCWRRVRRAHRYIQEADGLLKALARRCEEEIIVNPDGTLFFNVLPEVPEDLPLAISDAVHNLRSALDFLVYQLSKLDRNGPYDYTQWPIEHVKNGTSPRGKQIGFDIVVNRYLRGVSAEHRDMIEKRQPYNGADWAKDLRDISNPDKHRELTPISNERIRYFFLAHPSGDHGALLPSGDKLRAIPDNAVQIVLSDRALPIVATLNGILGNVIDTLNLFTPEF